MPNIIHAALSFELSGYALYQKVAKASKDQLSQMLFLSLAKQEKEHMNYIQAFSKTTKFEKLDYLPLEKSIKKLFGGIKKKPLPISATQIKGYELALKLEDKGYKLYQNALVKAKTPAEKKFFTFLMNMEKEHYSGLANVYFYFTQNDSWLAENESQTWNWMNL